MGYELDYLKTPNHPFVLVLVGELERVQDSLTEISELEIKFCKAARRSGLRLILPGKLWMTKDQPGTVIPDSGSIKVNQNKKFALSFWIRVPKRQDSDVSSHDDEKVNEKSRMYSCP